MGKQTNWRGIEKLLVWGQLFCVGLLFAVVLKQTAASRFLSKDLNAVDF